MQVGSRVLCVDDGFDPEIFKLYVDLPSKGGQYIIRDMGVGISINGEPGEVYVLLEGLINPTSSTIPFPERGFRADRFRELQPPAPIEEEILEEATA